VFVDGTVVNVALPALRADLDASLAEQQWIVEAYLLTLGSLILVGGSLGDLYGRRPVFMAGVAGFGVTSLLCAIAPSAEVLIAARGLQGVFGALLVPSSLAIITSTFPEGERGAAIGTWTAWTSASIAIGPVLGGFLVDSVSWRMVFAINVPLVIACLLLTARSMGLCPGEGRGRIDVVGAGLCALGLGGPVYALIQQPTHGWGAAEVQIPLLAGVAMLLAFVAWERRHPDPMLPLDIFRSRNFAVGNLATLTIYAGLGGATFFLALYLQQVGGYDAVEAGLSLTPITLIMLALARRFGALSERIGPRLVMGLGPVVAGAGLLMLAMVDARPDYLTEVLPGVLVFGLGLAMTVAPLTATVLSGADPVHAGIASGVNNAVARVAGLLAIAVLGAVIAGVYGTELRERLPGNGDAALVEQAKRRPFVPLSEVTDRAGPRADAAAQEASVVAFRWGMGIGGALVIAGGLISLVGIENPRRERLEPAAQAAA
jgi:EmrB/QacA subfamily drug resistance transporter